MNIVVVSDFADVKGGAAKIALGSAQSLAERGHQVFVFTAVGPVAPELSGVPGLNVICSEQFAIVTDPNRLRAVLQGIWNFKAARWMADLLARVDAAETVVHIHTWGQALSSSVVRTAVQRGAGVVLTFHDFATVCPNATLFNFQNEQICRIKPMSPQCWVTHCDPSKYPQKVWRVARQFVQDYAGMVRVGVRDFISVSDMSEQVLRRSLADGIRIHRVRNFVDAVKSPPVEVQLNAEFVYAGRLVPEKGVLVLADCAQGLQAATTFIGDGRLREAIRARYEQAQITGWLDADGTRERMRRGRALIFPSLCYETQGLVVAEAAAMGIPSIVSDCCAARESVEDGKTGLWFRAGDVHDLAQKMMRLRDFPALAESMGRAAYEAYWERPATISTHVKELEEIYRSLPRLKTSGDLALQNQP